MNTSKYTPGLWRVAKVVDSKYPNQHIVYVLIDDGRKRNVCAVSVYGKDESGKPTKTRMEYGERRAAPSIGDEECKANARLIAAAPDLLNACKECLGEMRAYCAEQEFDETSPMKPTFDELKAAIAKAEGREIKDV